MKATISLENLWLTIQSLSLNDQKWLSDKLPSISKSELEKLLQQNGLK